MGWFTKLCRNTGLMIHHATQPLRKDKKDSRVQISGSVEEEQVSPGVTLRRTTIEEIEFKEGQEDRS